MTVGVCQNQAERSSPSFVAASSGRCGLCSSSSTKSAHLFSAGVFLPPFFLRTEGFSRELFPPVSLGVRARVLLPLCAPRAPRPHHGFGLDCGLGREHLRLLRDCRATQRLLEQHQPEVNICPPFCLCHVGTRVHLPLLAHPSPLCSTEPS